MEYMMTEFLILVARQSF